MKRANRLMLLAGVVLAAVSFVAVLAFGSFNQQAPANTTTDVPVVVAAVDLPLGTELTPEALATVTRPDTEADDTYQRPEDLLGLVVRRQVLTGQALSSADFETTSNMPELSSSIREGLRAIAVPLSQVDSVGSLLQAGDYVDVILSLEDLDMLNPLVVENPAPTTIDGGAPAPYISIDDFVNNTTVKVVVQNVQVLAALQPEPVDPNIGGEAPPPEGEDIVVVLAVTPQQAEVVRFAQLDGNVSLVLRAPGDYTAADTATTGITLRELVDVWGVLPPRPITP